MAFLELGLIGFAFGAMALAFAVQERSEWRRLVARADAVLAREREAQTLTFDALPATELRDAA